MLKRTIFIAALLLLCLTAAWASRNLLSHHKIAALDAEAATRSFADAPTPRTFYGRRLEPAGNLVLHGAGQSDSASFIHYTAAVAPAAPMLFMSYVDLRDDLPAYFHTLAAQLDSFDQQTPDPEFISRNAGVSHNANLIVPQIGLALNRGQARQHYESQTAAGADDVAIAQLCEGLQSLHRPVFLRIGYEFNGPWNGYQPQPYAAAFRRIVTRLRSCNLQNVAAVWNWSVDAEIDAQSAGVDPGTAATRFQPFYPGDDAVDWWAVNLFTRDGMTSSAAQTFLASADHSQHPVMIAESTPKGLDLQAHRIVHDWFEPYFGLIHANPGIKAFCYIDWDWRAYPQWSDWGNARLEDAPVLNQWYRTELARSLYSNARDPASTVSLLRTTR